MLSNCLRTSNTDGSEDRAILYLKHSRLALSATEAIAAETVCLNSTNDSEGDPFSSISEGEFMVEAVVRVHE